MMKNPEGVSPYTIYLPESGPNAGASELVAAALHQSHYIEEDVLKYFSLSDADRLREEDPYTEEFTDAGSIKIIANYSRFRVDLNRPRNKAIYMSPVDAWGLKLYNENLPEEVIKKGLEYYDLFYEEVHKLFTSLIKKWGKIFVYDFHTYNYMRGGMNSEPADVKGNPEINIGTGNINREYWGRLVDRFVTDLRSFDFNGRELDVRENVRFRGGHFSKWISENFSETACVLAIEVKKFFMDEWTGEKDNKQMHLLKQAFISTRSGVLRELKKTGTSA